jgi:2-iminobutanoate/2-iminopropanoate deaminase
MYATGDDYVHALEVPAPVRWLFVSGTMGLAEDGRPGETLTEQLALVWDNLRTILASHRMGVEHIVRVTSYLRDAAYMDENAAARVAALNGRLVPTTAIVVQTLSPDWLVEIEVVAVS